MPRDELILMAYQLACLALIILWRKGAGLRFSLSHLLALVMLSAVVCGFYQIAGGYYGGVLTASLLIVVLAADWKLRGEKGARWLGLVAVAVGILFWH